ncbi:MAG: holo-ACP synthase [Pirellulales bacterium]
MGIVGTGIDVIEVGRIARAIERYSDRFVKRVYTPAEVSYCRTRGVPAQHLAGRFAAKEAVLKALGTGWVGGIRWQDIEVMRGVDGQPTVDLRGAVARRAQELGVNRVFVSISHTSVLAMAHAIAEADTA